MSSSRRCASWPVIACRAVSDAGKVLDLFGEVPERAPAKKHTRPSRAYAAMPGTGPTGHTCGDCQHLYRTHHTAKKYLKCALQRAVWTSGGGTDVKARSPACSKWESNRG